MDPHKRKAARRLRRRHRIRKRIFGTSERPRLTVTRSLRNIHCQIVDDSLGVTLASASSLTPELRQDLAGKAGGREGAARVGTLLAKRIQELGIGKLAFDRNGYRFHGRVAALAEALRKEGIEV
ncbi:MAG: 50S ribosomal protein L18 [Planctomycetota bacterium]